MKIVYLFIVTLSVVTFTGCGVDNTSVNSSQGSSQESSQESSKEGYEGTSLGHYQGKSCARCHSPSSSGGENEHIFTSGATIFSTLDASNATTKAVDNYSLRLVLAQSGDKINYGSAQGSGNVYATFTAGGIAKFTAQVVDAQGGVVNRSLKDSHDASRFDCNSCHTSAGKNNAPGRIVSFSYTTSVTDTNTTTGTTTVSTKSFANDVEPILRAKCVRCHGNSGRFSITNNAPYAGTMQFTDTTTPASSRLLQKGSGTISHGGGAIFSSTDVTTISDWISQGAKNN